MRLLTPSGSHVGVRERRWPLAGLDIPGQITQSSETIPLVKSATGRLNDATYVRLYNENPWIYACVQAIAWGLSIMPLKVYELLEDGQRRRVRGDLPGANPPNAQQRLDVLLHQPHDGKGMRRLVRRMMVDYLIFGNAMWGIEYGRGIEGFWNFPWRRCTVHEGETVPILGYEMVSNRGLDSRFFAPEDVIHFNVDDDPESVIGRSPMKSLKYTLALHDAIQRHLVKFFENSARPSGNLKLDKSANKETISNISNIVRELYTAPENAGKVIVTSGEFQPITSNHEQSQLVELAKLSREEIAGAYRIPPPVIGILERAIKSNVKELREQYVRDVVGSWSTAIEDDLAAQLIPRNPRWRHLFIEFDLSAALKPDLESRARAYKDMESTLTTNERRRLENLPDLEHEDADDVLIGSGSLPLSKVGEMGPTEPGEEDRPELPPADEDDDEDSDE